MVWLWIGLQGPVASARRVFSMMDLEDLLLHRLLQAKLLQEGQARILVTAIHLLQGGDLFAHSVDGALLSFGRVDLVVYRARGGLARIDKGITTCARA